MIILGPYDEIVDHKSVIFKNKVQEKAKEAFQYFLDSSNCISDQYHYIRDRWTKVEGEKDIWYLGTYMKIKLHKYKG